MVNLKPIFKRNFRLGKIARTCEGLQVHVAPIFKKNSIFINYFPRIFRTFTLESDWLDDIMCTQIQRNLSFSSRTATCAVLRTTFGRKYNNKSTYIM